MENIAKFTVNVPKSAKSLVKFADKKRRLWNIRNFDCVCFAPDNGMIAATNGHIMDVCRAEFSGEWPAGARVLVEADQICKVAGKNVYIHVEKDGENITTFMEHDGETYTFERTPKYPDFAAVIPSDAAKDRKNIYLSDKSVKDLRKICNLTFKGINVAVLDVLEGSTQMVVVTSDIVCDNINVNDYTAYSVELDKPAEFTGNACFNADYLDKFLSESNGAINLNIYNKQTAKSESKTGGVCLIFPRAYSGEFDAVISEYRASMDNAVKTTLAADLVGITEQVRALAVNRFKFVEYTEKPLTALEVVKSNLDIIATCDLEDYTTFNAGNVSAKIECSYLYKFLNKLEQITKSEKTVFFNRPTPHDAEFVDALAYSKDGNKVMFKGFFLTKFADGIYINERTDEFNNVDYRIFYEKDGLYWDSLQNVQGCYLETPEFAEKIKGRRADYFDAIRETAANNGYIRLLEIEVFRRLGCDTADLERSRAAAIRAQEEDERRAKEANRAALERAEQMERERKAAILVDGRERLLSGKEVNAEQIELLADSVGLHINGRTLGLIRERITRIVLKADGVVSCGGYNLNKRNISATAAAVREIAERLKAKASDPEQERDKNTEQKGYFEYTESFGEIFIPENEYNEVLGAFSPCLQHLTDEQLKEFVKECGVEIENYETRIDLLAFTGYILSERIKDGVPYLYKENAACIPQDAQPQDAQPQDAPNKSAHPENKAENQIIIKAACLISTKSKSLFSWFVSVDGRQFVGESKYYHFGKQKYDGKPVFDGNILFNISNGVCSVLHHYSQGELTEYSRDFLVKYENVTENDFVEAEKIMKYCEAKSRFRVRTTPQEVAYFAEIRRLKQLHYENMDKAEVLLKRAYEAENIPLVGTLSTPRMFAPKSPALKAVSARFRLACDASARFLRSVGAKRMKRLHDLELAGVFDT